MIAGVALVRGGKAGLAAGVAVAAGMRLLTNAQKQHLPEKACAIVADAPEACVSLAFATEAPQAAAPESQHAPTIWTEPDLAEAELVQCDEVEALCAPLESEHSEILDFEVQITSLPAEPSVPVTHPPPESVDADHFAHSFGPLIWEDGAEVASRSNSVSDTVWYQPHEVPPPPDWDVEEFKSLFDLPVAEVESAPATQQTLPVEETAEAEAADVDVVVDLEAYEDPFATAVFGPDAEVLPAHDFHPGLDPFIFEAYEGEDEHSLPGKPSCVKGLPENLDGLLTTLDDGPAGHVFQEAEVEVMPPVTSITSKVGVNEIFAKEQSATTLPQPRPQATSHKVPVADGFGLHGLSPQLSPAVFSSRVVPSRPAAPPSPTWPAASVHRSMEPMAPILASRRRSPWLALVSFLLFTMAAVSLVAGFWNDGEIIKKVRSVEWSQFFAQPDVKALPPEETRPPAPVPVRSYQHADIPLASDRVLPNLR